MDCVPKFSIIVGSRVISSSIVVVLAIWLHATQKSDVILLNAAKATLSIVLTQ